MIKYALLTTVLTVSALAVAVIDSTRRELAPNSFTTLQATEIHATGIVEGATREVQLRSEIVGRVTAVLVKPGEQVQAGDVLVRLDSREQAHLVAASRARLALAQAQLDRLVNGARDSERQEARALLEAKAAELQQAVGARDRIRALNEQSAVSDQEADDAESAVLRLTAEVEAAQAHYELVDSPARADEVRKAEANVAVAEAELKLAEVALTKCELRAPQAACVLDVDVEPGELLSPDRGMPAVVLADTSELRVRAFVEEIAAPRIKAGLKALIRVDGLPGEEFHGVVTEVSPRMTAKHLFDGSPDELYDTKVREVLVALKDATRLMVGLRVDVVLTTP